MLLLDNDEFYNHVRSFSLSKDWPFIVCNLGENAAECGIQQEEQAMHIISLVKCSQDVVPRSKFPPYYQEHHLLFHIVVCHSE